MFNNVKFNPTYSVDMLVVDYRLRDIQVQKLMDMLAVNTCVSRTWQDKSCKGYEYNYSVKAANSSFYIGIKLFGEKNIITCRLRFNPNKVECDKNFVDIHNWFVENTSPAMIKIRNFDCAIDMPIPRLHARLLKDKRHYSLIDNGSDDVTEYLGANSKVGRVKLYNKTREAGLSFNLTRLEVTSDLRVDINDIFPRVLILDSFQLDMSICDTDLVLLHAVVQDNSLLRCLPRKRKDKITRMLNDIEGYFSLDIVRYNDIKNQVIGYAYSCLQFHPDFLLVSEESNIV